MQVARIIKTGLVVGVAANVWDFLTNTFVLPLLGRAPASVYLPEELMMERLVITDFIGALVFVWFFDRVRSAYAPGVPGGVAYGLTAGILINVPTWVWVANLFRGFPYVDAAIWTVTGIVWAVLMGAVAGWMWERTAPATP